MLLTRCLSRYKSAILSLPVHRPLNKEDMLTEEFLMERKGRVETYYAPHNEYLNPSAKVMIVGITPGFTQMKLALEEARQAMQEGREDEEVCRRSKAAAGLAGSMRANAIRMLDELGLHEFLGIVSSADLFTRHRTRLHTTSILRFPVFNAGKNYTGSSPSLVTTPFLLEPALINLQDELGRLDSPLIIPLGKTVENVLRELEREGKVDGRRCLWGFPHPSGANGHRHEQFVLHRDSMRKIILSR